MSIGSLGVSAGNLASLQALVFSYIPYSPPYSADPQYRSSFSINATTNVTINLWLLIQSFLEYRQFYPFLRNALLGSSTVPVS